MFRLNEEYITKAGQTAKVICMDSPVTYAGKKCPILALVKLAASPAGQSHAVYPYGEDGRYLASGNPTYDLISNEPNEEEAELIRQIGDICEGSVKDREEAMLKVIRQLRKK